MPNHVLVGHTRGVQDCNEASRCIHPDMRVNAFFLFYPTRLRCIPFVDLVIFVSSCKPFCCTLYGKPQQRHTRQTACYKMNFCLSIWRRQKTQAHLWKLFLKKKYEISVLVEPYNRKCCCLKGCISLYKLIMEC